MRATRRPRPVQPLLALAALAAAAALATAPAASAQVATLPSAGSAQICVGTQGGFMVEMNGFGTSFPANTTGTTTFTFANGDVVTLESTTNDDGIFHTATFTIDLRDPELAALVGTIVHEEVTVGTGFGTLDFQLVGCPTAPNGKVECMDGGFLNYPALGFLNQGDCVSWIATQGKNEPGKNIP